MSASHRSLLLSGAGSQNEGGAEPVSYTHSYDSSMAQKERASLFPLIAESIKNVSKDSSARFLREIIMKKNFFQ